MPPREMLRPLTRGLQVPPPCFPPLTLTSPAHGSSRGPPRTRVTPGDGGWEGGLNGGSDGKRAPEVAPNPTPPSRLPRSSNDGENDLFPTLALRSIEPERLRKPVHVIDPQRCP